MTPIPGQMFTNCYYHSVYLNTFTASGAIQMGSLLRNEKVSEEKLIAPVVAATSSCVAGLHVLLIEG